MVGKCRLQGVALACVVSSVATSVFARLAFVLPETLYAVPGVECNVYYFDVLDSVNPSAYAFEAEAEAGVGQSLSECWRWTPRESDAGARRSVVFRAWSDDGLVAAATTTVRVARAPRQTERRLTVAQIAASSANCLYQDQIFRRMREAGFSNYTPVGSHSGGGEWCKECCRVKPGFVPHDGYGGFTFGDFLRRWRLSPDEESELQNEAEREQLRSVGVTFVPDKQTWQAWRRHLLKSPLLQMRGGRPVIDVQSWLNRINEGRAPDILIVDLGGNGVFNQTPETIEAHVRDVQLKDAAELLRVMRAACPDTLFAMATRCVGACDQSAYGKNYGGRFSQQQAHKNFMFWNRALMEFVRTFNDPHLTLVPVSQSVDPLRGYPSTTEPASAQLTAKVVRGTNAIHPTIEGGRQIGDAYYAWLRCWLEDH